MTWNVTDSGRLGETQSSPLLFLEFSVVKNYFIERLEELTGSFMLLGSKNTHRYWNISKKELSYWEGHEFSHLFVRKRGRRNLLMGEMKYLAGRARRKEYDPSARK